MVVYLYCQENCCFQVSFTPVTCDVREYSRTIYLSRTVMSAYVTYVVTFDNPWNNLSFTWKLECLRYFPKLFSYNRAKCKYRITASKCVHSIPKMSTISKKTTDVHNRPFLVQPQGQAHHKCPFINMYFFFSFKVSQPWKQCKTSFYITPLHKSEHGSKSDASSKHGKADKATFCSFVPIKNYFTVQRWFYTILKFVDIIIPCVVISIMNKVCLRQRGFQQMVIVRYTCMSWAIHLEEQCILTRYRGTQVVYI